MWPGNGAERLGKVDNCQVGVFLGYAAPGGHVPVDRRLYLTEERAADRQHRKKTHVPKELRFQEKWRIGLDLLDKNREELPHAWVTADDEFGRVTEFRAQLRLRHENYVLDVPSNTLVRKAGSSGAFRVNVWAARQPAWRWKTITIRDGEKGPLRVRALKRRMQTKEEDGHGGPTETVLVVRPLDQPGVTYYALSNVKRDIKLATIAWVKGQRHRIEEILEAGNGEVGLDHYEVRGWVGWHHHMTLTFLALWFLTLEKRRVGKKNAGHDGGANTRNLQQAAPAAGADSLPDCQGDQQGVAA